MLSAPSIRLTRYLLLTVLFLSAVAGVAGIAQQQLTADEVIRRSVEVNRKDWDEAPRFDYYERDQEGTETRTYEEMMLAGSRYGRLVAVDDKPLSPEDEVKEQQRFKAVVIERQQESAGERERRVGRYQKEWDRDHALLAELTKALDFQLLGKQNLGDHEAWVLRGTPRPGYRPPNQYAKALRGMQGTLWIDTVTFHWMKAEAEVVHPVWLYGFAARIEEGTHFELEQKPTSGDLWMPSHFLMDAKATVLLLFPNYEHDDSSYFNYHEQDMNTTLGNHASPMNARTSDRSGRCP